MKEISPEEQVLRASLSILNSLGYGALSLTEVAKKLKQSKQRVYYHYSDSETILLSLAKRWSETGQLYTLKALADTKEHQCFRIKAIAEGMFDWIEADTELARLGLVLYQLAPQVKKLNEFMTVAKNAARQRIRNLLLLHPVFDKLSSKKLDSFVMELHSVMYGYFFYIVAMNQYNDIQEVKSSCMNNLQNIIEQKISRG